MLTHIAQLSALVLYGNAYLQGDDDVLTGFFPENSTFKFCEKVHFTEWHGQGQSPEETPLANNPIEWLALCRKEKVAALRLQYTQSERQQPPERTLAGLVGGGGRWTISTDRERGIDVWDCIWDVGNQAHPDQKIWHVKYGRTTRNWMHGMPTYPARSEIIRELNTVLPVMVEIATGNNLPFFAEMFQAALDALNSPNPTVPPYHADIWPNGMGDEFSRRILTASGSAWVFGAMGSWNDVGVDDADVARNEEYSERLYRVLCAGIPSAVNAVVPGPIQRRSWLPWRR